VVPRQYLQRLAVAAAVEDLRVAGDVLEEIEVVVAAVDEPPAYVTKNPHQLPRQSTRPSLPKRPRLLTLQRQQSPSKQPRP
jgi:hypothetical protein